MNIKLKPAAMVLGMALITSAPAFASDHHSTPTPQHNQWRSCGAAPEVDPSLGFAGITFLAGSLAVLRSRLRK
ncbi:MAG: hypothetical protein ABSF53_17595 [Terracidiphilus sp.]|jgi:hypothetical protein